MATLNLKNIKKHYDDTLVLKDINVEIKTGDFIVIIGPSGCGKSTLLRSIAGLEEISSGDIVIDGKSINNIAPAKRGIAMVFQSYALYPHMNVYENMSFSLKIAKFSKEEIDKRVKKSS